MSVLLYTLISNNLEYTTAQPALSLYSNTLDNRAGSSYVFTLWLLDWNSFYYKGNNLDWFSSYPYFIHNFVPTWPTFGPFRIEGRGYVAKGAQIGGFGTHTTKKTIRPPEMELTWYIEMAWYCCLPVCIYWAPFSFDISCDDYKFFHGYLHVQ